VVFLGSCNPVKKVLADIDKVKQVRKATDDLFPCVNDSVFVSKTDTLTTYDTAYQTDTVRYTDTFGIREQRIKVVTKTVRIRDTVKITIKDNREIKSLEDDIRLATDRMIKAQAGEIKARDEANKYRKQRNNLMWVLVALGIIGAVVAYFKFKSKPAKVPKLFNPN